MRPNLRQFNIQLREQLIQERRLQPYIAIALDRYARSIFDGQPDERLLEPVAQAIWFPDQKKLWSDLYLDYARKHSGRMISEIGRTSQKQVRSVLQRLISEGLTGNALQRELRKNIKTLDLNRSRTIARTEVHSASSASSFYQALDQSNEHKTWISGNDTRVRDSHVHADGQRVLMMESFIVGDSRLAFPGDPTGSATEIINCRCGVLYD